MNEDVIKEFHLLVEKAKSLGANYADVRFVHRTTERISTKNSDIESITSNDDSGFGIRVLANGSWGFASSSYINKNEMLSVLNQAVDIAKASSILKKNDIVLSPVEPVIGDYQCQIKTDPFSIPFKKKIDLLIDSNKIMKEEKNIQIANGNLYFLKEDKLFISSEGSQIRQERIVSGGGIFATAMENSEVQKRSYPVPFGGDYKTGGYEVIEDFSFQDNALETAKQASLLLKAEECPKKITDIIIGSVMLGIHVHETCGHPTELDRVLGTETSFAGTSFLMPDMIGSYKYGSDIVNIEANATIPGAMGSFFYDDEGVKAQKYLLVNNGIFKNYLTSRETSPLFNQKSNGTMRADGWSRIPLIRMTNINLLPGEWDFSDLVKDTNDGIFMDAVKSWSIDDKRWNFQFGCEIAYEIKNGKIQKLLKNPVYTGNTQQFWNSCDAICNKEHWKLIGIINCGKGEPGQSGHISHGSAPSRFRNIQVGVK